MADNTRIEWADATWNPVVGCKVVSPGCTKCYAMRLAGTRLRDHASRKGLTRATAAGPVWNGKVRASASALYDPLRWRRPRDIFACAHADLFYEGVPDDLRARIAAVMHLSPRHRFLVLTKRPQAMLDFFVDGRMLENLDEALDAIREERGLPADDEIENEENGVSLCPSPWPAGNVMLGISAEDQARFDERMEPLAALHAAGWRTWASLEPMLGRIDISRWAKALDWVVVGGESGPGARPMHPMWAREVRDACDDRGIPFFFKQWGEWREFDHGSIDEMIDVGSERAESVLAAAINPGWVTTGGKRFHCQDDLPEGVPCRLMERVGKRRAGDLLDGVRHHGKPE